MIKKCITVISVLIVALILSSCNPDKSENGGLLVCNDNDAEKPIQDISEDVYQAQLAILEKAYNEQSLDLLQTFITNWENSFSPISCVQFEELTETEKKVYRMYTSYYNPFNIKQYQGSDVEDGRYAKEKYIIVQTDMRYSFKGETSTNILNLRPNFDSLDAKVLYLTEQYEKLLDEFFDYNDDDIDFDREQFEKYRFLNNLLQIMQGHNVGFMYVTHPLIYDIKHEEKNKATLFFRMGYGGGESILVKQNGVWKITESEIKWEE